MNLRRALEQLGYFRIVGCEQYVHFKSEPVRNSDQRCDAQNVSDTLCCTNQGPAPDCIGMQGSGVCIGPPSRVERKIIAEQDLDIVERSAHVPGIGSDF